MQRRELRVAMALAAVLLAVGVPSPAAAAPPADCEQPLADLRISRESIGSDADDPDQRGRVALLFSTALQDHPECAQEIRALGHNAMSASGATGAEIREGRGFLGPVGWWWNTIYYRVFQGSAAMMATFGWVLFLSPAVMVLSLIGVTRGISGALRRPTAMPPDALQRRDAT